MGQLAGQEDWVDGLNVIITLEVMLCDSTLLSCMDGAIRDLASLRGTYRIIAQTTEAARTLFDVLQDARARGAHVLLDKPVSNSGRLKALVAEVSGAYDLELDVRVADGVDRLLYGRQNVISSDSVVLDRCASWVNLTRHCVELRGSRTIKAW